MLVVLLAVSWLEAESGNRMRLWAMLRTRAVEITWCLIWLVVVAANELLNRGSGGPATHLIQTLYGIMWYSVGMLATLKVGGNLRFVLMFLVIAGVACVVGLPAMWDNPMLARLASNGKTVEAFGDEASAKAVGIFQAYSAFSIIVASLDRCCMAPAWSLAYSGKRPASPHRRKSFGYNVRGSDDPLAG